MRKILFRGKRVDNGEWVYGGYVNLGGRFCYIVNGKNRFVEHSVVPETVGQYTGYTDDYAKKIFEGDILRVLSTNCFGNDLLCYTLTLYDMTDSEEMELINTANEVKVIGNIHDNPELLEGVQ